MADAEAVVERDGDVAGVVETVDVGAQEQPVGQRVRAAVRVGAHVRGLERGQRVLARDGAGAVGAQTLSEDTLPVAMRLVDSLATLDARVPLGVVGDPVVAGEEHRLREVEAIRGLSRNPCPSLQRSDAWRGITSSVTISR